VTARVVGVTELTIRSFLHPLKPRSRLMEGAFFLRSRSPCLHEPLCERVAWPSDVKILASFYFRFSAEIGGDTTADDDRFVYAVNKTSCHPICTLCSASEMSQVKCGLLVVIMSNTKFGSFVAEFVWPARCSLRLCIRTLSLCCVSLHAIQWAFFIQTRDSTACVAHGMQTPW